MKRAKKSTRRGASANEVSVSAIDLFCGVGGLTKGLEKAGVKVRIGVDIDPACAYPYNANNDAIFLLKSVSELSADDFADDLDPPAFKLLAGCAPCQPFSTYQRKMGPSDDRWHLLRHFGRLVKEIKPDFITMENVPNLEKQDIFREFVADLEGQGFTVTYEVVNCADFGVPQQRHRLVLLASKLGPISLIRPRSKTKHKTVRQAISGLPALAAGEVCEADPLHQASELSPLNLKRIRASKPGGSWSDWNDDLVAKCHTRDTGKTYRSVYGRMSWDEPAPTMTTQYFGFGNGRFGHPQQNRAISLREGAILQSFPKGYKFTEKGKPIYIKTIGRLIGNAVPVKLGQAIGNSVLAHAREHFATQRGSA